MSARRQRDAEVAVVRPAQPRTTHEAVATATERRLSGAMEVPIDQVVPDPEQPRKTQKEAAMLELTDSVRSYGILQPLIVRENGALADGRARYTIVAGGRRFEASRRAGLAVLPVVVLETEGARTRILQLIENIHREDLAPVEQAAAVSEIYDAAEISAEELGRQLHKSGQWVRNQLTLFADPALLDAVREKRISSRVAVEINRMGGELGAEAKRRVLQDEKVTLANLTLMRSQRRPLSSTSQPQTEFEPSIPADDEPSVLGTPFTTILEPPVPTIQTQFELSARATDVPSMANAGDSATPPAALAHPLSADATRVPMASTLTRSTEGTTLGPLVAALAQHHADLERVLEYGAALEWSCTQLLSAVREVK